MISTRSIIFSAALVLTAAPASAALISFETYVGSYGVSTDGVGLSSGTGKVSASIPGGSTVTAAYLYTATQDDFRVTQHDASSVRYFTTAPSGVRFDGNAISFDQSFPNHGAKLARDEINLSSHRADVTSIVAGSYAVDPTLGVYDFDYAETADSFYIDGSALVVVYENPALANSMISILNGAQDPRGDVFDISFSGPIDPTDPAFVADLFLGISFSCCDQGSSITANSTLLTQNAGNSDETGSALNGQLITVGGYDDGYSPLLPDYDDDSEKYDLSALLSATDTSLLIETSNLTEDDSIFLAVLNLTVQDTGGHVGAVPLPAGLPLFIGGFACLALFRCRRN